MSLRTVLRLAIVSMLVLFTAVSAMAQALNPWRLGVNPDSPMPRKQAGNTIDVEFGIEFGSGPVLFGRGGFDFGLQAAPMPRAANTPPRISVPQLGPIGLPLDYQVPLNRSAGDQQQLFSFSVGVFGGPPEAAPMPRTQPQCGSQDFNFYLHGVPAHGQRPTLVHRAPAECANGFCPPMNDMPLPGTNPYRMTEPRFLYSRMPAPPASVPMPRSIVEIIGVYELIGQENPFTMGGYQLPQLVFRPAPVVSSCGAPQAMYYSWRYSGSACTLPNYLVPIPRAIHEIMGEPIRIHQDYWEMPRQMPLISPAYPDVAYRSRITFPQPNTDVATLSCNGAGTMWVLEPRSPQQAPCSPTPCPAATPGCGQCNHNLPQLIPAMNVLRPDGQCGWWVEECPVPQPAPALGGFQSCCPPQFVKPAAVHQHQHGMVVVAPRSAASVESSMMPGKLAGTWYREVEGTVFSATFTGSELKVCMHQQDEGNTVCFTLTAEYSITKEGLVHGVVTGVDVDVKQEKESVVAVFVSQAKGQNIEFNGVESWLADCLAWKIPELANKQGQKITVISPSKVNEFKLANPKWCSMHPSTLSKHLGADHILRVNLDQIQLFSPGTQNQIYEGRAVVEVSLHGGTTESTEPTHKVHSFEYPRTGVRDAIVVPIATFKTAFLQRLAEEVGTLSFGQRSVARKASSLCVLPAAAVAAELQQLVDCPFSFRTKATTAGVMVSNMKFSAGELGKLEVALVCGMYKPAPGGKLPAVRSVTSQSSGPALRYEAVPSCRSVDPSPAVAYPLAEPGQPPPAPPVTPVAPPTETSHPTPMMTPPVPPGDVTPEGMTRQIKKPIGLETTYSGGMTLPSGRYLQHAPQYFAPEHVYPLPRELAAQEMLSSQCATPQMTGGFGSPVRPAAAQQRMKAFEWSPPQPTNVPPGEFGMMADVFGKMIGGSPSCVPGPVPLPRATYLDHPPQYVGPGAAASSGFQPAGGMMPSVASSMPAAWPATAPATRPLTGTWVREVGPIVYALKIAGDHITITATAAVEIAGGKVLTEGLTLTADYHMLRDGTTLLAMVTGGDAILEGDLPVIDSLPGLREQLDRTQKLLVDKPLAMNLRLYDDMLMVGNVRMTEDRSMTTEMFPGAAIGGRYRRVCENEIPKPKPTKVTCLPYSPYGSPRYYPSVYAPPACAPGLVTTSVAGSTVPSVPPTPNPYLPPAEDRVPPPAPSGSRAIDPLLQPAPTMPIPTPPVVESQQGARKAKVSLLIASWRNKIEYIPDTTRDGVKVAALIGQVFLLDTRDQNATADGTLTVELLDANSQPAKKLEQWQLNAESLKKMHTIDMRFGGYYELRLPCATYHPPLSTIRLTVRYDAEETPPIHAESATIYLDHAVTPTSVDTPKTKKKKTGGKLSNVYSVEPTERMKELLYQSEGPRSLHQEWRRFWFNDQQNQQTPERIHGGILK